jgi:hypothetical protein
MCVPTRWGGGERGAGLTDRAPKYDDWMDVGEVLAARRVGSAWVRLRWRAQTPSTLDSSCTHSVPTADDAAVLGLVINVSASASSVTSHVC